MQRDTSLSSCFSWKDHCTLDITLYLQLLYSFVWISHSFKANVFSEYCVHVSIIIAANVLYHIVICHYGYNIKADTEAHI